MSDSQKFLSRNRAPRVQIEYDVELYGAEKKVQLPFVMGVMSDLSGKATKPDVSEAAFLEIDADNFDARMRGVAPRVQFTVPNTLTGEGSLSVDMTFTKMSDFSPAAIASKVDALRPLLEARTQLSNLMAYMDGKSGAEALIERILANPMLLQALAGSSEAKEDVSGVLSDLAARSPSTPEPEDGTTDRLLSELAASGIPEEPEQSKVEDVLSSLQRPEADAESDDTATEDALETLRAGKVADGPSKDGVSDILAAMPRASEEVPHDSTDDILAAVDRSEIKTPDEPSADDILSGIQPAAAEAESEDTHEAVLKGVAVSSHEPEAAGSDLDDILSGIEVMPEETATSPSVESVLSGIEIGETVPAAEPMIDDVLKGVAASEGTSETSGQDVEDILAGIEDAPEDPAPGLSADDILNGIEASETGGDAGDRMTEVLEGVAAAEDGTHEASGTDIDDILADIGGPTDGLSEDAPGELEHSETKPPLADGIYPSQPHEIDAGELDSNGETGTGGNGSSGGTAPEFDDDLDALLSGMEEDETEEPADEQQVAEDDLDTLLVGVDEPTDGGAGQEAPAGSDDDLDALLAGMEDEDATAGNSADGGDAAEDDLEALLADMSNPPEEEGGHAAAFEPEDDLDALLAGMDASAAEEPTAPPADEEQGAEDDLDALLAGIEDAGQEADLSNEMGQAGDPVDDLDALLADVGAEETESNAASERSGRPAESGFGTLTAQRPSPDALDRKKFRMAVFGDFSGRSARGVIETGSALAGRKAILLDVDEIEEVIEGFATTLVLPLSADGAGVAVPLRELDDLHPDELYENVEIFDALAGLRQQLQTGSMAARATERLHEWSRQYATPVAVPQRSAAAAVPADRRLSDFQSLIGDTKAALTRASPMDELIARIVGPHVVKAPDEGVGAMLAAVESALESAMRLILHHPEFQAVEAQWRSLDLLARRVETDEKLEIVLYDVSAEELAVDLSAVGDLSESGLFGLLNSALDPETGDGGFSALFGLYSFEETPPHAELLGRIGQVAAFADAPFFAAMSPAFLDTPKEERHPLVAKAWDTLRAMPEAAYVGLASPRFLLRLPYGAKSEPVSAFPFEEFSHREGLSGMLWSNPVVLVAILLAAAWKKDGKAMSLGGMMSLGDMPFHYVTDRHGDQVALPCTERNMTQDAAQKALLRGYMPVVSPKGRNEVRLASFRSLGGDEIMGPWNGDAPRPVGSGGVGMTVEMDIPVVEPGSEDDIDASLDELLAGFADEPAPVEDAGDDDMDPELAALLEGL